jgi:hypothetical protein
MYFSGALMYDSVNPVALPIPELPFADLCSQYAGTEFAPVMKKRGLSLSFYNPFKILYKL